MVKNKHERGRKYASKETFVHCIMSLGKKERTRGRDVSRPRVSLIHMEGQ